MTHREQFDTREERDARWRELKKRGHKVFRSTDQVSSGKKDKKERELGKMVWVVLY